jgi:hypothetical protein
MGLTRARWVHRLPHSKNPPRKKITPERVWVLLTLDHSLNKPFQMAQINSIPYRRRAASRGINEEYDPETAADHHGEQ